MTRPRVTVVVPTHNRHTEVKRAVTSALAQTVADLEVIVVDDGSSQPVTFDGAAGDDPRVRVLRHDPARGVSAARNSAVDTARGAWVAFLDDDDFWAPNKLELQLRAAAEHAATLVYSSMLFVAEDGRVLSQSPAPRADDLTRRLMLWNVVGGPSTVLVARDALRRVGPFDPQLAVIADWDMWIRLSQVCKAVALSEATTAILVHPGSMQTTQVEGIGAEMSIMEQRYSHLLADPPVRFGSAATDAWIARSRWQAERSLRNGVTFAYWYVRRPSPQRYRDIGRIIAGRLLPAEPAPDWVQTQFRN